jgi:hypothetical protein
VANYKSRGTLRTARTVNRRIKTPIEARRDSLKS